MFRLPDSWLWDFWLVDDTGDAGTGSYHLFFLYASRALHDPHRRHLRAGIGHAVSTDLVTWERVSDALVHGSPPSFDQTATWTGSITQGPDGTWFMYYTGTTLTDDGALLQQIGLATSADLHHWERHQANPLVRADARWYETIGGESPWRDEHWRDPWVFADPDGDGWHMLITARANTGPLDDRGVIGHARSPDLIHWDVQPPLSDPGAGFGQLEVPQVEWVNGRAVLIFNSLAAEFSAARTVAHGGTGGVFVATAETLLGPYNITGATPLTDDGHYVGKLIRNRSGEWVLLAFENLDPTGTFVGALSDPMPVRCDGGSLTINRPGLQAIADDDDDDDAGSGTCLTTPNRGRRHRL